MRGWFVLVLLSLNCWAAEPVPQLPAVIAPEFVQNAISAKAVLEMERLRQGPRDYYARQIQDIQRVLVLDEVRLARLNLAAEGVVEAALASSANGLANELETLTRSANPRNVEKLLAGYQRNVVAGYYGVSPIWEAALKQVLTESESALLKKVKMDRWRYRVQAVTALLRMMVQERVGVTAEQMGKLSPLLATAVGDYLEDLGQELSSESGFYTGYVPLFSMAVPEKEAKAIITDPGQWKRWEMLPGDNQGSWRWIKQAHDERVKRQKTKR
jgi:hypothetical protein